MDTKEIFSKRLLELREEKGISRQIAADSLQISRASLEYYEKGLRLPDVCVLAKIADYYGVSADYLLGRSEIKNIDPDKKINAACEYTGLSERAIDNLREIMNESTNSIIPNLFLSSDYFNLLIMEYENYYFIRTKLQKEINEINNKTIDCLLLQRIIDNPDMMKKALRNKALSKEAKAKSDQINYAKWKVLQSFDDIIDVISCDIEAYTEKP